MYTDRQTHKHPHPPRTHTRTHTHTHTHTDGHEYSIVAVHACNLEKGGVRIIDLDIVVEELYKYFGTVGSNLGEQTE